jgi:hypothetical protein
MPSTYTLISSNILGSNTATVTFSAIPSTYTDIVFRWSARSSNANVDDGGYISLNESIYSTTNYSQTILQWYGATPSSYGQASSFYFVLPGNNATSNSFGSSEMYLPNYAGSTNKIGSLITNTESNATDLYQHTSALLKRNTAAITSVSFLMTSGNFLSGSSFYLYGVKNA